MANTGLAAILPALLPGKYVGVMCSGNGGDLLLAESKGRLEGISTPLAGNAVNQSLSDPGHLGPPKASEDSAVKGQANGACSDDPVSNPMQTKRGSPLTGQEGGFGSFMHGQVSPGGVSGASPASPAPDSPDKPVPSFQAEDSTSSHPSPEALTFTGHINGQSVAPANASVNPCPALHTGTADSDLEEGVSNSIGGQRVCSSQGELAEHLADNRSHDEVGLQYFHTPTPDHNAHCSGAEVVPRQDALAERQYAPVPGEGCIPSPWVSYWYSDWPESLWDAVFDHSPELFYYHFQIKMQAEAWGDVEWQEYRVQNPEHYNHIEYFNVEWGMRGPPMHPMPVVGEPLITGGVASTEWLEETARVIEAGHIDGAVAVDAFEPVSSEVGLDESAPRKPCLSAGTHMLHANGEDLASVNEMPTGRVRDLGLEDKQVQHGEVMLVHSSFFGKDYHGAIDMAPPCMLSADALIAAATEHPAEPDANPASIAKGAGGGELGAAGCSREHGYFPDLVAASPAGKLMAVDDLDFVPDMQQVQEIIARYAVPMRPESCAGSDDDRLYLAQPAAGVPADGDCEGALKPGSLHRGVASNSSTSGREHSGNIDDVDGGPCPGPVVEDVEDGFGDMGSMLAAASPSSCYRHDAEARVTNGALGSAVAAADSAAAMRHLEAALDTQQVCLAQPIAIKCHVKYVPVARRQVARISCSVQCWIVFECFSCCMALHE